MSVDLSKIKPGDEVTVRATVSKLGDGCCYDDGDLSIQVRCTPGTVYRSGVGAEGPAAMTEIVSHTPKALAVGDRVKIVGLGKDYTGEIWGLHKHYAWIAYDSGRHTTENVDCLERLP